MTNGHVAGSGGMTNITWSVGKSPGIPKSKSVTYDRMHFSYDYVQRMLSLKFAGGESGPGITLDEDDLMELKAAMIHFGISISTTGGSGGGGGTPVPGR